MPRNVLNQFILTAACSLVAVSSLTGCSDSSNSNVVRTHIEFTAHRVLEFRQTSGELITRIAIEIAESDSAQARGLMDRRSLPERGGMIFVSQAPSERSFWMRSTPLPLDLIFVHEDSTIVNIVKRTTPYSDNRILSEGPAQFVVEVRAGFTDKYGIEPGHRITWWRQQKK